MIGTNVGAILFPIRDCKDITIKEIIERMKLLRAKYTNLNFFFHDDIFALCCRPKEELSEEDFENAVEDIRKFCGVTDGDKFFIDVDGEYKTFSYLKAPEESFQRA